MNLTHLALAVVIAAGASSFVAFRSGENHERGRRAQIDLAASVAASEVAQSKDAEIAELSIKAAEAETTRQQAVREIRTNTHEIIREPAMAGSCLPVPAVGLLDAATDIANGKAARQSVPVGNTSGVAEASPAG